MSELPQDLRYTTNHEWVRQRDDGRLEVGITDHAQEALGDLVYVELPETGREVEQGEVCAVVESVKAAADVYSPVSGMIEEVNEALSSAPELINQDPYGTFIFVLHSRDPSAVETLLDAEGYARLLSEED